MPKGESVVATKDGYGFASGYSIDFATIVSFLTAPILGYLNLRVVTAPNVAPQHRPGRALVAWSYAGLVLLGGTALVYLWSWM